MIRIPKYVIASALLIASSAIFVQTTHAQQQLNVPQGDASLNWSGYVAEPGANATVGYTSVTGTWVVPSVSANTSGTADAAWVGIGGVETRDLIQAGTQAIVEGGKVTYSAWIETLPGFSKTVPLEVRSGDSVTATLSEESPDVWRITIQNNTEGTSYGRTVLYGSSHSSAEWIEEMVSNGDGTFRPLDSFGTVGFTKASATLYGTGENLSQLGAAPLQMINGAGSSLAAASTVGSDDASFSVVRTDAPAIVAEATPATIVVVRHRHRFTFTIVGL
jgi:hypothetical protein